MATKKKNAKRNPFEKFASKVDALKKATKDVEQIVKKDLHAKVVVVVVVSGGAEMPFLVNKISTKKTYLNAKPKLVLKLHCIKGKVKNYWFSDFKVVHVNPTKDQVGDEVWAALEKMNEKNKKK